MAVVVVAVVLVNIMVVVNGDSGTCSSSCSSGSRDIS